MAEGTDAGGGAGRTAGTGANLRLERWRTEVERSVEFASPLLLGLAAREGLDLAVVARRLRTPVGWTRSRHPRDPLEHLMPFPSRWPSVVPAAQRKDPRRQAELRRAEVNLATALRRTGGILLRSPLHEAGGLAVRPGRRSLEMAATFGTTVLATDGDHATLWFDAGIPDDALWSTLFRRVAEIVRHPLLGDGRWRINGAWRTREGDATMMAFMAPAVPHRLPPGWTGRKGPETDLW